MEEKRKKLLHLPVSWSVYKDFMNIVQQKRGYYKKGDLSICIERLMKSFIADYTQQQQSAQNLHKHQKRIIEVAKTWRQISQYILEKHGFEIKKGVTVPLQMLEEAIRFTHGSHHLTLDKWTQKLVGHEYIKPLTDDALAFEVIKSAGTVPTFDKKELR